MKPNHALNEGLHQVLQTFVQGTLQTMLYGSRADQIAREHREHRERAVNEIVQKLGEIPLHELLELFTNARKPQAKTPACRTMSPGLTKLLAAVGNEPFRFSDVNLPLSRDYVRQLIRDGHKIGALKRVSRGLYQTLQTPPRRKKRAPHLQLVQEVA